LLKRDNISLHYFLSYSPFHKVCVMLAEASMQQLPELLLHPPSSTNKHASILQSRASVVVGAVFVPVSDVTSISSPSLLALNGWKGCSEFNFDTSPEDEVGCRCAGLMIDMRGNVMRKWLNSTGGAKCSAAVASSNWEAAERARPVSFDDIIAVTYAPHPSASSSSSSSSPSSSHAAAAKFGSWFGGVIEIRVEGQDQGFLCCGEVPEGNVPGARSHV
jgi:hypothetical protein